MFMGRLKKISIYTYTHIHRHGKPTVKTTDRKL